jgi:DNA-binding transcriptional regulator YiaG
MKRLTVSMSGEAFKAILEELHLSPARAAILLGITERTAYRWIDGSRDVSEPGARLLVLLRDFDISPDTALKHFNRTFRPTR